MRIERQIHHYGSGLNALPMLEYFEQNPTDIYLLRVGYGGNSGPLTNIDQDGFASASFHSWPDTLAWDAYSGDYGPNFSGLVMGAGTYVVTTDDLGTVAFGGNVVVNADGTIQISPRDAVRRKVYLAQYGISITVDAGIIDQLLVHPKTHQLTVSIAESVAVVPAMASAKSCILRAEIVAPVSNVGSVAVVSPSGLQQERGGWSVALGSSTTDVVLSF